jgi:cytoskeletal protein CcmA (bactofilin family)
MRERPHPVLCSSLLAAAIASVCLFAALAPAAAQSGDARAGATPPTAARNVYAAGGQVRPAMPVTGDWTAAGGKVIVDQPVAGDATVAGGSVDVRAPVGDDVRAAGGDVSIESKVAGEMFAAGANITLTPAAIIGRSATLYGSSIGISGRIDGDLRATAAKVIVDGEVAGNARLVAEEIELGPKARIGGAISYASRSELKKAESAVIAGAVTREEEAPGPGPRADGRQWERSIQAPAWAGGVIAFLPLLAAAALFLLLLPRFGVAASGRLHSSPWLALGVGFGTIVALPVLVVLLFITLLGIPIGIALMALYPALMLAGFVVGVLFVSRLLPAALRKQLPRSFAGTMGYFALALLLTLLVASVPFIGGLLGGLLGIAGVGACVLELYGRRQGSIEAMPGQSTLAAPAS